MIEIIGTPKFESKKTIEQIAHYCFKKFKIDNNRIVEILFVNQNKMQELNFVHRKINRPTDVLSFPQSEIVSSGKQILGSIIICEEIGQKFAENDTDLVEHGFLHLLGYDHDTDIMEWDKAESKIKQRSL